MGHMQTKRTFSVPHPRMNLLCPFDMLHPLHNEIGTRKTIYDSVQVGRQLELRLA